jgi:integrase
MGRRRKHDTFLPRRMYQRRGAFYFVNPDSGDWEPLGKELSDALAAYGRKIGGRWSGRTIGDVIDRYRIEVLPLKRSEHTRKDQGAQLSRLKEVFGDMMPDTITTRDCYGYVDRRRTKEGEPAPVAARHEVKLLGHVFAKAIRWGIASANPVRAMEKEPRGKRTRYATDEEFAAVYALANERMQIAMDLALLTGLRRGDLLSLTWKQVSEGFVVNTSKTGAGLEFGTSIELEAVLARAKKLKPQLPRVYVLRTRAGRRYTGAGFSAIWQRLQTKYEEKHGGRRFTFHDIRRKNASDSGSVKEAQERLGHADEATTRRFYIAKPVKVRPLR